MTHDPLVATLQTQPAIEVTTPAIERPAPSLEQEKVADDLFSHEQPQLIATFLAAQNGMAILQHIIAETFPPQNLKPQTPPSRKPYDQIDE